MNYASTLTLADDPWEPRLLRAEASVRRGIPRWELGGGSRAAIEKIRTAIIQSGYAIPFATVFVHLSPAEERRIPTHCDLSLAASVLRAFGLLPSEDAEPETVYIGEIGLSGAVLPVCGLMRLLLAARTHGIRRAVIPADQASLAVVPGLQYILIDSLSGLGRSLRPIAPSTARMRCGQGSGSIDHLQLPLETKRALCIAAAGWHSMLLMGPPGTGKSTLARELAGFLPPPDEREAIEIRSIESLEKDIPQEEPVLRPVRIPHHSSTTVSMVGGGSPLRFGEVTRAHNGLLILDELAEFNRATLQALREPMSHGEVHVSRNRESRLMPADFLLIATSNPCPCGNAGTGGHCTCNPVKVRNYLSRIYGPLSDRIQLEVLMTTGGKIDVDVSSAFIRDAVKTAAAIQARRYSGESFRFNGQLPSHLFDRYLNVESGELYRTVGGKSQRKSHGILRAARTIADLDASEDIRAVHLNEAASFFCLDILRVIERESA